jgi:SAM-dependent methyltransferase
MDDREELDSGVLRLPKECFQRTANAYRYIERLAPPAERGAFGARIRRKARSVLSAAARYANPTVSPLSPPARSTRRKLHRYYERILTDGALTSRFVEHYLGGIPLEPDSVILDYGCGRGRALAALARQGHRRLYGMDVYRDPFWEQIDATFVELPLSCGDLYPFRSGSCDVVLNLMMLACLPPAALESHIDQMARIVRSGGWLAVVERNDRAAAVRRFRNFPGAPFVHDLDRLERLCAAAGFELVEQSYEAVYLPVLPMIVNLLRQWITPSEQFDLIDAGPKSWLDRLVYRLQRPERRGMKLMKFRKAHSTTAVGQRRSA